ncbi:MAG: DUF1553 domain-containing protein [Planctomycetaceae bacterium]|nr:DUF1553 domain-containing protein [Planctomycetaceae bacterium]
MARQLTSRHLWIMFLASFNLATASADDSEFFESRIRPLLATHCWDCHSVDNAESDLRLDDRDAMIRGGTRGAAIDPGKPETSLLVHAIRHSERLQMPPKSKLGASQIADLVQWIKLGAPWPNHSPKAADAGQTPVDYQLTDADQEFWAFRPPIEPSLPKVDDPTWVQSPIDRFILAGLESRQLRPSVITNKRKLIRRATFDLLGLPPRPEEVADFLSDNRPGAFARLVDRLLSSPRYGERWGRHWLDVARYADSNGLDENLAFGNAYRYRDYVIRSLNADKSFDRFVVEQIAGDLLETSQLSAPFDPIIATGFLSLGAKMLAEDDPVKMEMDIIDEQVDTIGRAFIGLTLGCARCHDHKFDPIPITDYYSIAGIFKSTKTMEHFNVVAKWQEHELATQHYLEQKSLHDQQVTRLQVDMDHQVNLANEKTIKLAKKHLGDYLLAAARLEIIHRHLDQVTPFGKDTKSSENDALKIDEQALPANHLLLEAEDFKRGNLRKDSDNYGPSIGVLVNQGQRPNKVEYEIEIESAAWYQLELRYAALESRPCLLTINDKHFELPIAAQVTGGWYPDHQAWHAEALIYLRAGKNVLRLEQPNAFPHIDKLLLIPIPSDEIIDISPINPAYQVIPDLVAQWRQYLKKSSTQSAPISPLLQWPDTVTDLQSWATAYRDKIRVWQSTTESTPAHADSPEWQALLDDPQGPFAMPAELMPFYPEPSQQAVKAARDRLQETKKTAPAIPAAMGVSEVEQPENLRVHLRGSHLTLGRETPRRFLRVIPSTHKFRIPENQSGRLQLAAWLTDPSHPLTARVIVNRLWQWHFGQGLVASPNNFGRLGQRPSHPDLLDWLALQLIKSKWSIKTMHRLMMNSATYQMSSQTNQSATEKDPENRLLSQFNLRRLEAEEVRDSVLAVSGNLDFAMGGTHLTTANRAYVTSTANVSPKVYDTHSRSVYLPVVRSALYEVLQSFDFPDPSVTTGKRQSTTVAPQALFMMNSDLVAQQAAQLARNLLQQKTNNDRARIDTAYALLYSRPPNEAEIDSALHFIERYLDHLSDSQLDTTTAKTRAWQSLCRALMSANEFIFVE